MKNQPSDEALEALVNFLIATSLPRLLAKKEREEREKESDVHNSPNGKD